MFSEGMCTPRGKVHIWEANLNVIHLMSAVSPYIYYSSFVFTVNCNNSVHPIGLLRGLNATTPVVFLAHTEQALDKCYFLFPLTLGNTEVRKSGMSINSATK